MTHHSMRISAASFALEIANFGTLLCPRIGWRELTWSSGARFNLRVLRGASNKRIV